MITVHVHIIVKNMYIDDFISLTIENARNSVQESGVIRFEFFRQNDDPQKFLLIEMYQNEDAVSAHKQTAHYARWKAGVEPMMAEPRYSLKYSNIIPEEKDFLT